MLQILVNFSKKVPITIWSGGRQVECLWPGNSPDLNPIENLWHRLQKSVFRDPRPYEEEAMIKRVMEEWQSITVEECRKLVQSIPKRIIELREKKGGRIKY